MKWMWSVVPFALCAAVPLAAQTVWQVPPTEEIQPYVDRAAPGDRIELLPHTGSGGLLRDVRISKSLQIVGLSPPARVQYIIVEDLPRGSTVTLSNIPVMAISVLRCAGTVVMHRVSTVFGGWGACNIYACESVLMSECSFWGQHPVWRVTGSSGLEVRNSTLRAVDCEFFGTADRLYGGSPGAFLWASHVELDACRAEGTPGFEWYDSSCWCIRRSSPKPGVYAGGDSTLILTGGCEMVRGGGTPGGVSGDGATLIRTEDTVGTSVGWRGQVIAIPNQPRLGAPPMVDRASLFSATVDDRPGALALLFADLDTGPPVALVDLPLPIGLTGSAVLMSLGLTDAAGSVTLPAAVPADPLFHHRALYLQAVVGQPVPLRYGVSAVRAVLTN